MRAPERARRPAARPAERLRDRTRPRLLRNRSRLDGGTALHAGPGAAHGRLARGAGAAHAPAPAHARSWLLVRAAWVRRPVVAADSERRRRVRVHRGGVSRRALTPLERWSWFRTSNRRSRGTLGGRARRACGRGAARR